MIIEVLTNLLYRLLRSFFQMKPHQTLGGFKTISDDLANANAVKNAKPTGLCVSPFSLDRFGYIDALYR